MCAGNVVEEDGGLCWGLVGLPGCVAPIPDPTLPAKSSSFAGRLFPL